MFNQLKNAAASFSQNNNNNNQNQQQQQGGAAYNGQQQQQQPGVAGGVAGTGAQPQAGAGDGGGDALDKGIAFLSKKMGMKQVRRAPIPREVTEDQRLTASSTCSVVLVDQRPNGEVLGHGAGTVQEGQFAYLSSRWRRRRPEALRADLPPSSGCV